jgi:hypothetical protein
MELDCTSQNCSERLTLMSPDDEHTELSLTKPKEDFIKKEYKCNHGHVIEVYWSRKPLSIPELHFTPPPGK